MMFSQRFFIVQCTVIWLANQATAIAHNAAGKMQDCIFPADTIKAASRDSESSLDRTLRDLLRERQYKKAIPYFEKQLELTEKLHGSTSLEAIQCSYEFSLVLKKAGERDRAAQLQAKAAAAQSARDSTEQGEGDPSLTAGRGVIGGGDSPSTHTRHVGNITKYRDKLVDTLMDTWHPKIILPLLVQLVINKNGHLRQCNLIQSSGNKEVDSYTLRLIRNSKFPSLPDWLHSDHITVSFELPRRR